MCKDAVSRTTRTHNFWSGRLILVRLRNIVSQDLVARAFCGIGHLGVSTDLGGPGGRKLLCLSTQSPSTLAHGVFNLTSGSAAEASRMFRNQTRLSKEPSTRFHSTLANSKSLRSFQSQP